MAAEPLDPPSGPGALAPRLATGPDGAVLLSWLEPDGESRHALRYALLREAGWSQPREVASGDDWFINWADVPSVVPLGGDRWAAHWLVRRPEGSYAYDVALAQSADAGRTWSPALTPHDDDTPTEHGFVTLFPWNGVLGAVWLDGRNMAPAPQLDSVVTGHAEGAMSLRFARITEDGHIVDEGEIEDRVCDCCPTDVALAGDIPIVSWRGRTGEEIRDIKVTRFVDGAWAAPLVVGDDNWRIPGCPVNGPALTAEGDLVAVAWYAAPERNRHVSVAFSLDGGESFPFTTRLDEGDVIGRAAVVIDEGSAIVAWLARDPQGSGQLRVRRARPGEAPGPVLVLAEGDTSRGSGFPRLLTSGGHLVYAWTDAEEPTHVRAARARLTDIP